MLHSLVILNGCVHDAASYHEEHGACGLSMLYGARVENDGD